MRRQIIDYIREFIASNRADAFFCVEPRHVKYITGFCGISEHEKEASVLVSQNKIFLFVPRMYAAQAQTLPCVKNGEVICIVDSHGHGIQSIFVDHIPCTTKVLIEKESWTLSGFDHLEQRTSISLKPISSPIKKIRQQKHGCEIENIKKAIDITGHALLQTINFIRGGIGKITELDVVDFLAKCGRKNGADKLSFDPIVASGAGSAQPYYKSTDKFIESGALLIDLGYFVNGYTSDITRTFWVGKPNAKQRKNYDAVLKANEVCISLCKPGMSTKTIYEQSNKIFLDENLDNNYLHSLGHGIGLDVHELPILANHSKETLKPGMVHTVEPGLYFLNDYGIRIEDDILITNEGCTVLSKNIPKELILI